MGLNRPGSGAPAPGGCPWDERTCAYAAKKGHLEVFKWARARGCPCSAATERIFARLSAESQGGPR